MQEALAPTRNRRLRLFVLMSALTAASLGAACQPAPPPPPPPVSPDTWAVVDGQAITRDQVEKAFRRVQDPSRTLSEEEALTAKLSVLEDLIVQEILLARARELKIEVSETELDAAFAEAKEQMSDDGFQQELTRRDLTIADMRDGLRRELFVRKVIEQDVESHIQVTDQEVTGFFTANRDAFNFPEEVYHLAQIVVTPVRDAQINNRRGDDATTVEAANAKASMLMARLKEGASFSELAMDYSEDPETTPRGGDLGFVPLSMLKQAPAPLRNAVLNAEPGSARLVSQGGAHTILLIVAHERAGQRDLSTPGVRERITDVLQDQKEQLLRAAYVTDARSDADVTNYLARRLVESRGKLPASEPAPPAAQ